jgi:hypothetical protein
VGSSGIQHVWELRWGSGEAAGVVRGANAVGGGGSTVSSSSPELMAEAEREGGGEHARLGLGVRFTGEDA